MIDFYGIFDTTNTNKYTVAYAVLDIIREYIQTGIDPKEIELKVKQGGH